MASSSSADETPFKDVGPEPNEHLDYFLPLNPSDEHTLFKISYLRVGGLFVIMTGFPIISRLRPKFHEYCARQHLTLPVDALIWLKDDSGQWREVLDDEHLLSLTAAAPDRPIYEVLFSDRVANSPHSSAPQPVPIHCGLPRALPLQRHRNTLELLDPRPCNIEEPYTSHVLEDIPENNRVLLYNLTDYKGVLFSVSHLLQDFSMQLAANIHFNQLTVTATVADGEKTESYNLTSTNEIWYILTTPSRCPLASDFQQLLVSVICKTPVYKAALASISADLHERLQFFVRDFLHLPSDDRFAYDFLTGTASEDCIKYNHLYLSSLYFTPVEQRCIYYFPTSSGVVLHEYVHARVKEKYAQSGAGHGHVCSSHDMAPIFQNVFNLHHGFYHEPSFQKAYRKFNAVLVKKLLSLAADHKSSAHAQQLKLVAKTTPDHEHTADVIAAHHLDLKIDKLSAEMALLNASNDRELIAKLQKKLVKWQSQRDKETRSKA